MSRVEQIGDATLKTTAIYALVEWPTFCSRACANTTTKGGWACRTKK